MQDMGQAVGGMLPLDATAPRRARSLMASFRERMDADWFDVLLLLLSEVVNNCLVHGGRTGGIEVHARREGRHVHVRVTSASGGTEPRMIESDDPVGGGIGL